MAYVEVWVADPEPSELSDDELIEELTRRVSRAMAKQDKRRLSEVIQPLFEKFKIEGFTSGSLDDRMKIEFLKENWSRFTFYQLEERLK
jgi:hypothetical protein